MSEFKFCPRCTAPLVERDVETQVRPDIPRLPLVCSLDCGFAHYDNPIPIVAVVVEYRGEIVLAHNRAWEKPFYGVITGFVDHGEAPELCAVREVKEELNLDASPASLIGVYSSEPMNQVIIGYHVEAQGEIRLNEELDDYKLVPPDQCIAWPTGTGYALCDWLRTRGIDPSMMMLHAQND